MIVNALDYVSGRLSYGDHSWIMASDKEISQVTWKRIFMQRRSYAVDQLFDGIGSDFNDPAQGPGGDRILMSQRETKAVQKWYKLW